MALPLGKIQLFAHRKGLANFHYIWGANKGSRSWERPCLMAAVAGL